MNAQSPPTWPTYVAVEDRGPDRIRLRLKQLSWTTVTVAATTWVCTFGVIPGILAVAVAKHVLVAILVMGVGLDEQK